MLRSPRIYSSYFRVSLHSEMPKMSIGTCEAWDAEGGGHCPTLSDRAGVSAARALVSLRGTRAEGEVKGRRARVVAAATEEPRVEASR